MHLVQILLPVYDNDHKPFSPTLFEQIEQELMHEFGGVTAYLRSPARGSWKKTSGKIDYDQIVIFEAMVKQLDQAWWTEYRQELERRFRQDLIIVRASKIDLL